jgi:hypothetical protein
VAGKYKNDDPASLAKVRKQSSGDLLPNKPSPTHSPALHSQAGKINRSLTSNEIYANNQPGTVKIKPNNGVNMNHDSVKQKNQNGSLRKSGNVSSPTQLSSSNSSNNIDNSNRVYKRNLSGFGRGKFTTNQTNFNNNSVGKLDRLGSNTDGSKNKNELLNGADKRSGNPFFY